MFMAFLSLFLFHPEPRVLAVTEEQELRHFGIVASSLGNDAACRSHLGPVVGNVDKARQVAEAVIAKRQSRETAAHYELLVWRGGEGEDWRAVQRPRKGGNNGGDAHHGVQLRIDYCTGKVTDTPADF